MKDHIGSALRSFAAALTAAALGALCIALMLALYDIPRTMELAFVPWAALLLMQALVCQLLVSRSATLLAYLLANGFLLLVFGEQVVARTLFIPGSSGFPVFLRICIWISGMTCAYAAQKQPGSNVFVRCADALIIAGTSYMAIVFALGEAAIPSAAVLTLSALLLCMVLTAALRAGGESDSVIRGAGAGGWLVLGALLGICLLLAVLLLSLTGSHIGGLVDRLLLLWNLIADAAVSILTAFALLMARLLGGPHTIARPAVYQEDSLAYQSGPMKETGTAPEWVVYLVMGLIAALIIAGILAILIALRRTRLQASPSKRRRRKAKRKSYAAHALRALLCKAAEAISFEIFYRLNSRSVQGLYVLAVRTCRLKRLPRLKRESPGAYIRRLHGILLSQSGPSTLDELAALLDLALYGGVQTPLSRRQSAAYAAQLRALSAPRIEKNASAG